MRLSECRALLTGASGGIGQALAEQLCAGGARVLLVGRETEAFRRARAALPRPGRLRPRRSVRARRA